MRVTAAIGIVAGSQGEDVSGQQYEQQRILELVYDPPPYRGAACGSDSIRAQLLQTRSRLGGAKSEAHLTSMLDLVSGERHGGGSLSRIQQGTFRSTFAGVSRILPGT